MTTEPGSLRDELLAATESEFERPRATKGQATAIVLPTRAFLEQLDWSEGGSLLDGVPTHAVLGRLAGAEAGDAGEPGGEAALGARAAAGA